MALREDPIEERDLLSIGRLSERTGLPVETIRTWERRYGYPEPIRRPSGHRRYRRSDVERLRLIRRALDEGHRPARTVALDLAQLRRLLEGAAEEEDPVTRWLGHVRRLDGAQLERELRVELATLGQLECIRSRILPFLRQVGELWCRGELGVGHEHFASERIEAFLAGQWRPLSDVAVGPPVICAALPDNEHVLPLHLAAWVLAGAGHPVRFLGANTPLEDVARLAGDAGAAAVLTAASPVSPGKNLGTLKKLRRTLPGTIDLLVGGDDLPALQGLRPLASFDELAAWAWRGGFR